VPAYFDDTRRKATKDAAASPAGRHRHPRRATAAALAYSLQTGQLAAATSTRLSQPAADVLRLHGHLRRDAGALSRRRFECLGIEGDVRLGGQGLGRPHRRSRGGPVPEQTAAIRGRIPSPWLPNAARPSGPSAHAQS